jgi:hypothetical protein
MPAGGEMPVSGLVFEDLAGIEGFSSEGKIRRNGFFA